MKSSEDREIQATQQVEEMKKLLKQAQSDGEIDKEEAVLLMKKQWEVEMQQKLTEKDKQIEESQFALENAQHKLETAEIELDEMKKADEHTKLLMALEEVEKLRGESRSIAEMTTRIG